MCTILSVEAVRAFPNVCDADVDQRMCLMQEAFCHFDERSALLPPVDRNAVRRILCNRVMLAMLDPAVITEQLIERQCREGMTSYPDYRLRLDAAGVDESMARITRIFARV